VWDPRKDFSQRMQPPATRSTFNVRGHLIVSKNARGLSSLRHGQAPRGCRFRVSIVVDAILPVCRSTT